MSPEYWCSIHVDPTFARESQPNAASWQHNSWFKVMSSLCQLCFWHEMRAAYGVHCLVAKV